MLPYLRRLRQDLPADQKLAYLDMIEERIKEITGSFLTNLSHRFHELTPSEIHVAELVKEGRTTKEIAQILFLSENTVRFHRRSLRRKLDLKEKKINLRTHLLFLTEG